ncbi:DEAD/DEAH box helicase [Corallococcus exiguus]|uniref:DEAD/DEAH box helicase n=4 Tax=Corallococcus TaxID=83461 RepID=A0A7X4Y8I4_9BACT|nr:MULTISPECIES: DEAD/DEAH box helicase [Corallococcus]NBC40878.1 DEAD/DEAH box helicase [Corallococcus exiguus]NNC20626.1 DEAD/DEAH box helicase [Corallococcus exiguus]RUO87952.1 DEAD/DEAH box helicase [Corallococcus sp. AB018]
MSDIQEPTPGAPAPDEATTRPGEYIADISFEEMNLSEPLRRALAERGYTSPTPVQAKAFGPAMAGKDLIVRSKTGTGKTAAFGLPLLEKIPADEKRVRALILCPTRELALQVAEELTTLAKYKGVKVAAIYGGASMKQQEDALEEGTPIIVGTPGRVFDHINRGNLKLDGCDHAILDEADEMLNQGFYEEVTRILDRLPKTRQVLLFSATVPTDIQNLIARYTTNAETLLLSGDVFTVEHIHHIRYDVSDQFPKPRNLIYILEKEEPSNAIIFCNTRDDTALVTAVLNRNGFDAELLNGDLPQKERERVMGKVKRGEVAFMVATDIAARGIDISGLEYVINYSLPEDPAVYLHRVGRTGRIGNKGTAINLFSGRELATFTVLEKKFGIKFEMREMPAPEEAMHLWTERHVRELREGMGSSIFEGFLPLATQLKQRPDADDLIAFLIKYYFSHLRMEKAQAAGETEKREPVEKKPLERRGKDRDRERDRERPRREERGERTERPRRDEHPDRERRPRRDEPRREDRGERRGAGSAALEAGPGETKLWVNLGTADGLGPGSIATAMEDAGAPLGKMVRAELRPTFAYVFVAEEDSAGFEALNGKQHGGKTLRVEKSKPRSERDTTSTRPPPSPDAGPGEVKLWVNLGMDDGMDEAKLPATLEAMGAPAGKVIKALTRPTYGYVYVPEGDAEGFESLNGKAHNDKPLKLERHRPRGQREERRPRHESLQDLPGQARLWVGLGRQEGLDEAGVTAALEAAGAPAGKVLRTDLRPTYAYVFVAEEDVEGFESTHGKPHGEGKTLKVERAKRK